MLHLIAGAGTVAQNASLASIPRLVDILATNSGDGYYFQRNMNVITSYVRGDSLTAAQFNAPNLRLLGPPQIEKYDTAADPPNLPPINEYGDNGPVLLANDPFNVQVSRTGAGGSVCQYGLWVGPGVPVKASGECRTLIATGTITGSTSAWVAGTISFTNPLPAGRYRILGMEAYGTNLLFARIVFPDSNMRPGVLAKQANTEYGWDWFRYGNLGVWGEFTNTAPPSVEILCYGACTAQTFFLDLVKVG